MFSNQKGFSFLSGTMTAAGAAALLSASLVYDAGAVRVSIQDRSPGGHSFGVIVPAALVSAGMSFVPDKHLQQVPPEAVSFLPALEIAVEELKRVPDGPLVEVEAPGERVSVALRDGTISVDVEAVDESVHVRVPLGLVRSVVRHLRAANPPSAS